MKKLAFFVLFFIVLYSAAYFGLQLWIAYKFHELHYGKNEVTYARIIQSKKTHENISAAINSAD